jgi:mono/diheme cytochrome c family protein
MSVPSRVIILKDDQVADVLTYIRNSWGNSASAVDAAAVRKERQALVERSD